MVLGHLDGTNTAAFYWFFHSFKLCPTSHFSRSTHQHPQDWTWPNMLAGWLFFCRQISESEGKFCYMQCSFIFHSLPPEVCPSSHRFDLFYTQMNAIVGMKAGMSLSLQMTHWLCLCFVIMILIMAELWIILMTVTFLNISVSKTKIMIINFR